MTENEAKEFLIGISYKLGNMAIEYLTEKDGEKMREAIKALEQELCDDAISRQAVIDESFEVDTKEYGRIEVVGVDAIEALPPVNPQPKTGHWIIIDDCEQFIAKCSECGRIEDSRMISKYPYCHCGAKMVEPQEEGGVRRDDKGF